MFVLCSLIQFAQGQVQLDGVRIDDALSNITAVDVYIDPHPTLKDQFDTRKLTYQNHGRVPPMLRGMTGQVIFYGVEPIVQNARILFIIMSFCFVAWGIHNAGKEDDPNKMYRKLIQAFAVVAITANIDPIVFGPPNTNPDDGSRVLGRSGGLNGFFHAAGSITGPDSIMLAGEIIRTAWTFQNFSVEPRETTRLAKLEIEAIVGAIDENATDEEVQSKARAVALAVSKLYAGPLNSKMMDWTFQIGDWFGQKRKEAIAVVANMEKGVWEAAQSIITFIRMTVMGAVAMFFALIVSLLLIICSWIVAVIDCIRYFLLMTMSIMLPVFLSGMLTESWKSAGRNFVLQFIGVLSWPLGFALGNLGTLVIFRVFCNKLIEPILLYGQLQQGLPATSSGGIIAYLGENKMGLMVMGFEKDAMVTNALRQLPAQQPQLLETTIGAEFMQYVGTFSLSYWAMLVALLIAMLFWMIFTTILTPVLMNAVIAQGSSYYMGATQQTAQQVQNVGMMIAMKSVGAQMLGKAIGSKGGGSSGGGGGGDSGGGGGSGGSGSGGNRDRGPSMPSGGGYRRGGGGGVRR